MKNHNKSFLTLFLGLILITFASSEKRKQRLRKTVGEDTAVCCD